MSEVDDMSRDGARLARTLSEVVAQWRAHHPTGRRLPRSVRAEIKRVIREDNRRVAVERRLAHREVETDFMRFQHRVLTGRRPRLDEDRAEWEARQDEIAEHRQFIEFQVLDSGHFSETEVGQALRALDRAEQHPGSVARVWGPRPLEGLAALKARVRARIADRAPRETTQQRMTRQWEQLHAEREQQPPWAKPRRQTAEQAHAAAQCQVLDELRNAALRQEYASHRADVLGIPRQRIEQTIFEAHPQRIAEAAREHQRPEAESEVGSDRLVDRVKAMQAQARASATEQEAAADVPPAGRADELAARLQELTEERDRFREDNLRLANENVEYAAASDNLDVIREDRDRYETELAAVTGRVDALAVSNRELKGRVEDLSELDEQRTGRIEELSTENASLSGRLAERNADVLALTERVNELGSVLAERDEAVAKLIERTPQRERYGSPARVTREANGHVPAAAGSNGHARSVEELRAQAVAVLDHPDEQEGMQERP